MSGFGSLRLCVVVFSQQKIFLSCHLIQYFKCYSNIDIKLGQGKMTLFSHSPWPNTLYL